MTRQDPIDLRPAETVVSAICCLAIIAALVLGVGLATNLVLRHVVQTAPLWIGVILGFRRSRVASWAALPLFLVWLVLMALIWLYLLGISNLLSGHFAPVEIAMTIIAGVSAIGGVGGFIRFKSSLSPINAGGIFVLMLAIQLACLRISFLPAIAHR
jgi:FtsH-binding integral membrane protein